MGTADNVGPSETGRPWWMACCAGCLLLLVALFAVVIVSTKILPEPVRNAFERMSARAQDLTAGFRR